MKKCKDHLGREFSSLAEMGRYWGIPVKAMYARFKMGWSLEDTLTKPSGCKDHLGNVYINVDEMCKHYGINKETYYTRVQRGLSLESALTLPLKHKSVKKAGKKCQDHLGREYKSLSDMCRHYNITLSAFKWRIDKCGWSLEKALTTPIKKKC